VQCIAFLNARNRCRMRLRPYACERGEVSKMSDATVLLGSVTCLTGRPPIAGITAPGSRYRPATLFATGAARAGVARVRSSLTSKWPGKRGSCPGVTASDCIESPSFVLCEQEGAGASELDNVTTTESPYGSDGRLIQLTLEQLHATCSPVQ
jgi:hypothetical protein